MLRNGTILSTAFDDYTIIEQIGQGGSGTVFLAESTDGDKFAIKAINKNNSNRNKIKRFKNEINFCLKNDHKNIIKIIDFGLYENDKLNCLFYVMPFYDSNLRKEIEKGIELNSIINIFLQLLSGLDFAHKKRIWHRDIKPENILYDTSNNTVIIADFGIAHFCEEDIITAVETKVADRLANFTYASPEQRTKGIPVDGRADIYALGLILNEMFTKSVVGGSSYKKIADITEEYSFLDELVDKIICQNFADRLFPINSIEIELFALLKAKDDNKKLKEILDRQIIENESDDPLFNPINVKDITYTNSRLNFQLDKKTNKVWDNILKNESFSHYSSTPFPKSSFNSETDPKTDCTIFYVHFSQHNEHYIDDVIKHFKEWLPIVSNIYIRREKQRIQDEFNAEIAKKEQEAKNKQKEIEINKKLKAISLN